MSRLPIDWTLCDARGMCTGLLPDLLIRDDWGYPLSRKGEREPQIPPGDMKYAKAAVKRCPRLALKILD